MTRIGPVPAPIAPPQGGPITAIVAEADAAVVRLAAGTILAAQVVGRDAAGLLLLRTERGALSLRTAATPPSGSTVLVEVQNIGTQITAVVLAIRKPVVDLPQLQNPDTAPASVPEIPPRTVESEPAQISLRPGNVVVARLLPATSASPALPGGVSSSTESDLPARATSPPPPAPVLPPVAGGIRLTLRTVVINEASPMKPSTSLASSVGPATTTNEVLRATATVTPANSVPAKATSAVPPSPRADSGGAVAGGEEAVAVPQGARPTSSPAAPQPSLPPIPRAPPWTRSNPSPPSEAMRAPVSEVGPSRPSAIGAQMSSNTTSTSIIPSVAPRSDAAEVPRLTPSARIEAIVEGWMPPDRLMLRTPYGVLVTQATNGPLPGTRVIFEVLEAVLPGLADTATTSRPDAAWPALDRALRHLTEVEPAIARELIRDVLPNAGGNTLGAVLAFLRAARTRDQGGWIGGAALAALTSSGRGELVGQLMREFNDHVQANASPSPDWRAITLPFHDGASVQAVRFAFRQRRSGDRSPAARRFLVTLETSRLGPLQFDGLVVERRFELIVRSGGSLSGRHRDGMRIIFEDSCGIAGLNGHIAFAAGQGFVDPMAAKEVHRVVDPVVA